MEVANSQLAAALLAAPNPKVLESGLSKQIVEPIDASTANFKPPVDVPLVQNEEEKEEVPSNDEFSDTESENLIGNKSNTPGKNVTLQMLLDSKILEPGDAAMTIEYLGQKFVGDLLPDGKIKSHETETIFCSPSAWAIHCKRIINPEKKSGCGWASVKYKGKKLDAYKAAWLRRMSQQRDTTPPPEEYLENEVEIKVEPPPQRIVVKHNTIPSKMVLHDANILVEAISFASIGKMQPFLITIGSNACLVMDLHCHLMLSEVCGYLAGTWDLNSQTAHITHAYPCLTSPNDPKPVVIVEAEIQADMEKLGLNLMGWYHSHPTNPAMPSLRDCDSQLDYQIKMKGPSESTYTPCVGIIVSPYNPESPVSESSLTCFWVVPPHEQKPTEYPRPFMMQYSFVQDYYLTKHVVDRIQYSAKYYSSFNDIKTVSFSSQYKPDITYLEKLKCTLRAKFPKEKNETLVWNFVKDAVGCRSDDDDKVDIESLLSVPQNIARPKTPQVPLIPNIPSISTLQQMVSMPVGVPPINSSASALSSFAMPKFEIPTPLNIPIPPSSVKASKSSSSSLNLPSGLDVLTSMTMGLGPNSMSMGLSAGSLDALTASSLLANLPPGISSNLAASFSGSGKASDPTSFAASLAKISGSSNSHKMMPSTSASSSLVDSLQSVNLPSNIPSSLSSSLMMNSADLANAFFQTSKFPSTSSLLGIPDPLSKSTLAANNMFLSPSLLKMQEALLKPLTSNSTSYKSIIEQSYHSKSSQDILKNIKDFLPPDINLTTSKGKQDNSHSEPYMKPPDISISPVSGMKRPKVPDFSAEFGLSSSKTSSPLLSQVLDHNRKSRSRSDLHHTFNSPSPIKVPRTDDYSSLNLSLHSAVNLAANSGLGNKDPGYQSLSSLKRVSESYLNDLPNHDNFPENLSSRTKNSADNKSSMELK